MDKRTLKWAGLAAAFLFLALAPLFLSGYWVRLLTNVFMFAVMAEGWNIVGGFCGYASFGNVVFFGIGAYTTCIFMVTLNMPFVVGAHYFQLNDEPVAGRNDGENYNIGIVNEVDVPYPEMVSFAKAAHRRLYSVHAGEIKPVRLFP